RDEEGRRERRAVLRTAGQRRRLPPGVQGAAREADGRESVAPLWPRPARVLLGRGTSAPSLRRAGRGRPAQRSPWAPGRGGKQAQVGSSGRRSSGAMSLGGFNEDGVGFNEHET